jgi:replicative DNA helicase
VTDLIATLADARAEEAVVAAAVFSDVVAQGAVDRGLRPEHFTVGRLRLVYGAVAALVDEGGPIDQIALCGRLQRDGVLEQLGGANAIDALTASAVAIGNIPAHIARVIDLATWRARGTAATEAVGACHAMDPEALAAAEAVLWESGASARRRTDWTPQAAGDEFMSTLEGASAEVFPWPFARLNEKTDGGAMRGELTCLAGPITHGKSALLDECLESMHKPGMHVRLYLNEMKVSQRMGRVCARRSGVELTKIQRASRGIEPLAGVDLEAVRRSWNNYPVHITECSGWSIERIVRHARRSGADVVALDIINRLPHDGRKRHELLDEATNRLDQLAKECDMHVIVAAHLNRSRTRDSGRPPIPALSDIKESGALGEIPDNVLMVWREPEPETGDPGPLGMVRFAKNRTGELGGLEVRFQGEHQRFLPVDRQHGAD